MQIPNTFSCENCDKCCLIIYISLKIKYRYINLYINKSLNQCFNYLDEIHTEIKPQTEGLYTFLLGYLAFYLHFSYCLLPPSYKYVFFSVYYSCLYNNRKKLLPELWKTGHRHAFIFHLFSQIGSQIKHVYSTDMENIACFSEKCVTLKTKIHQMRWKKIYPFSHFVSMNP